MSKNKQNTSFLSWYNGFLAQFGLNKPNSSVEETRSSLTSQNKKDFSEQSQQFSNKNVSLNSSWIENNGPQPENPNSYSKTNTRNLGTKGFIKNNETQNDSTRFGFTEKKEQKQQLGSSALAQVTESSKQQVISITYEEIGLFPRSFNRVFDRFFKQLFFDVENLVIQEYRFYRYLFLTTVKCLFILISVPLFVNFCSKTYLIRPITEYYWNSQQPEIFLNSYMQKRAFNELKDFEERIYFESLLLPFSEQTSSVVALASNSLQNSEFSNFNQFNQNYTLTTHNYNSNLNFAPSFAKQNVDNETLNFKVATNNIFIPANSTFAVQNQNQIVLVGNDNFGNKNLVEEHPNKGSKLDIKVFQNQLNTYIQKGLQRKTLELAVHYNEESVEAITNFFADLMSFATLWYLISSLEIQINITKSFLLEVFFGLDDSKKSLLILFVTDLLVGYHSPNIWELIFSTFFDHYGLPENETTIFLLVATLPVLLDVLFKYLIFRHLNRASPATVATYHAMIE